MMFVTVVSSNPRFASPAAARSVAVQVELKAQNLGNHEIKFQGSRDKTRRFQAMGQLHSTCTAPPQQVLLRRDIDGRHHLVAVAQAAFESRV
jgi:hypothetical protein